MRDPGGGAFHRRMSLLPEMLTRRDREPSWLSRASGRGLLSHTLPGVYLRPDKAAEPVWLARAATAWRPGVVLGGEFAASLTFWRDLEVTGIDVMTRTTLERPGFRFHDRTVPPSLVGPYGYFQITLPALTALDLALTHGPETIDRVLRSRLVRIQDLYDALAGTPWCGPSTTCRCTCAVPPRNFAGKANVRKTTKTKSTRSIATTMVW